LLRLQARSMCLYCDPGIVHRIFVVENFRPGPEIPWRDNLLNEYGSLSHLVEFVRAERLGNMPPVEGWWTQQVLKLLVAHIVETDRYVVLDAKNHLVSGLTRDFLETSLGKARINGYSYSQHPLREALERTLRYVGVDPAQYTEFFPRTTTPFTFLTGYVQDLISQVCEREGVLFPTAFITKKLTEFFLYSGFLVSRGKLEETYDFSQPICPILWSHMATANDCLRAVEQAEDRTKPFFSIHRRTIAALDQEARKVIASFWHQRRLFDSDKSAISFLYNANPETQLTKKLHALALRLWRSLH